MTTEEKDVLTKTYALARENNEMLHSLKRSIRWGRVLRFIYWGFVIAGAIGAFVYIQPVVSSLLESYKNALEGFGQFNQTTQTTRSPQIPEGFIQQIQGLLNRG
ncbi:MAG: hypothetical protein COV07_01355 [Candidatus Vogelbacteria bacterium CG10_big_fil_rev_8_21_14_0_10_45_14]|uniref:Uncharacterized protein n=1 Tax=Candidatus Vogelbacteria bacterium CG10_big_fil_rev_8_21_14_0_10_45_14 TaxID=1975042 RepID=A0A2H0RMF8_9BACT|nr:MAG: hypothetical protein COV07_01355 [Candidatus Vogelbacteria bacterium CG10_big_fil_rev_8_21_14_0_10_45_14]